MNEYVIKYQAVIFYTGDDLAPTPDSLTYFINEFKDKELIPTTFQELTQFGLKNRFSMKSLDDFWNIEFAGDRMNIIKTNIDIGNTKLGSLKAFINEVINIVDIVFDKFPHKANRISIVTKYIFSSIQPECFTKMFSSIFTPTKLYEKNPPVSWKQRLVTRFNWDFIENKELINVITEINRVNGNLMIKAKNEPVDRIELSFDINTFQGNSEYRFTKDDIKSFYNSIAKLETSTKAEYKQILTQ